MNDQDYLNAIETGLYLVQVKDIIEDHVLDEKLNEKYGISFDNFSKLLHDLLPLCDTGKSPFTNKNVCGFSDKEKRIWLAKVDD
jgi:hypothetical protein